MWPDFLKVPLRVIVCLSGSDVKKDRDVPMKIDVVENAGRFYILLSRSCVIEKTPASNPAALV